MKPPKRKRVVRETFETTLQRHCHMCESPALVIPSFDNKKFKFRDRVRVKVTKLERGK